MMPFAWAPGCLNAPCAFGKVHEGFSRAYDSDASLVSHSRGCPLHMPRPRVRTQAVRKELTQKPSFYGKVLCPGFVLVRLISTRIGLSGARGSARGLGQRMSRRWRRMEGEVLCLPSCTLRFPTLLHLLPQRAHFLDGRSPSCFAGDFHGAFTWQLPKVQGCRRLQATSAAFLGPCLATKAAPWPPWLP